MSRSRWQIQRLSQKNDTTPKNMLNVKNLLHLPNCYKTLSHDYVILAEFQVNWNKIVDFLQLAIFWTNEMFFVTVSTNKIVQVLLM